jgi:hypothetical protein
MGWIYLREILLNRHRDRVLGLIGESARPPRLAASFISNETCDVRFWHLADIGLCAAHVCFRG